VTELIVRYSLTPFWCMFIVNFCPIATIGVGLPSTQWSMLEL
jgi:hypothetical protein